MGNEACKAESLIWGNDYNYYLIYLLIKIKITLRVQIFNFTL